MTSPGRKTLLSLSSCLVCLFAVEAGLRLLWHNPFAHEAPDRFIALRMQHANTSKTLDRRAISRDQPTVQFRTDERGYILPVVRRDRSTTVVFLGGSTTECSAVQEDLRFPALVGKMLASDGDQVTTLNAGRSGNTTHDAINILLNHSIDDAVDVAVLMEATNDVGVLRGEGSYAHRMDEVSTATDTFRYGLQRMSANVALFGLLRRAAEPRFAKSSSSEPPSQPPPLSDEQRRAYEMRVRAFAGVARAFSIRPVLMTQPLARFRNDLTPLWSDATEQDRFNGIVRQIAADERVDLIDLAGYVRDHVPQSRETELFYDGMHVTDAGSRLYAAVVSTELQKLLKRRP
jgi:lysophospholipase L1-like esterase